MRNVIETLKKLHVALASNNFPNFCLKPKQVQCFEFLLRGFDVITVLPTGFGKSLLFHLLPDFLPVKSSQNIVLVVCPLSSIIEDQIKALNGIGVSANTLPMEGCFLHTAESLFEPDGDGNETGDIQDTKTYTLPKGIVEGKVKLLFAHPEALLSINGRKLLNSEVYQQNVVACVIDEAHCVEMWGDEFRTDFKELSCLKAFFPDARMLALTATAPPPVIKRLSHSLCMASNLKIIRKNPNRENVFLDRKMRLPNQYGTSSYEEILTPIAHELVKARQYYPITIVYMKLKYCGFAYKLFHRILGKDQFVGDSKDPCGRLFAQYHAPQTPQMKTSILNEIKKDSSRIRVIFATTALGMGVNVPYVSQVIHIGPPSSLEAYMQEIGRAGRSGNPASAILYFSNFDIARNRDIIDDSVREYCTSEVCLRKVLLRYFGFTCNKQENCCIVCNGNLNVTDTNLSNLSLTENVRNMPDHCAETFYGEAKAIVEKFMGFEFNNIMSYSPVDSSYLAKKITDEIYFIDSERDLLLDYGIWNEDCSSALFKLITLHAPMVKDKKST